MRAINVFFIKDIKYFMDKVIYSTSGLQFRLKL